jgi:hypothetical protein
MKQQGDDEYRALLDQPHFDKNAKGIDFRLQDIVQRSDARSLMHKLILMHTDVHSGTVGR